MRTANGLVHGLRDGIGLRAVAWSAGPLLALLLAVVAGGRWAGIDVAHFTRDPSAVYHARWYVGLVSNVGIMLWSGAAGVCLFCAAIEPRSEWRRRGGGSGGGGSGAFFLAGGLITAMLLFDDLFMLHEDVFQAIFGIPEALTYLCYMTLTGGFLLAFRRRILASAYVPLAAALGLFALSILVDVALPRHDLLEDGAKLLGIGCWAAYFLITAAAHLRAQRIAGELSIMSTALARSEHELEGAGTALAAMAEFAREAGERREQVRDQRAQDPATRLPDVVVAVPVRRAEVR